MARLKRFVLVMLLLAGCVTGLFWQQKIIGRLESENAALRNATADVVALREENARLAQARTDPAELERLRAGQSELVRLRSQVAQLRKQLADAAAKPAAPTRVPPAPSPAEAPAVPVETYSAALRAAVPWKQTLVTGGWMLPSGKRALMFIQPVEVGEAGQPGQPGQVMLQARLIEMPDSALTQLGMDGMRSDQKQSAVQGLLTAEQTDAVTKALEQIEGVNVLAAPRVVTADGRQAQVKVAETKTSASGEAYEVGPVIDIVPRISTDGGSVEMTVSAALRLPAAGRQ
jgi:hypothetical protein